MCGNRLWNGAFRLVWIFLMLRYAGGDPDVSYDGKLYVSEGDPFAITCIRSVYGSPKWYKNGLVIDPDNSEFSISTVNLSIAVLQMELSVKEALWRHRGNYKCDSLNEKFHRIEVVPSEERDQQLRIFEKGRQKRVQLIPGKTLKLVCNKEDHYTFSINWYKDGHRLQEVEDKISMKDRDLTIRQADEQTDTGDYVCVFEEKGQSYLYADHQGSRTWVTYAARVEGFLPQYRPILASNMSLECKVQGFPTPRIAWFVDGIDLQSYMLNDSRYGAQENDEGLPNAVFFINDVTYDDNREIMCKAENVEGFDKSITLFRVRGNSIYTNEDDPGNGLILTPGLDLVLSCNYTGDESAVFLWFKDGQQLNVTPESRFHLNPPTNNILRIEHALETDCGNYSCTAKGFKETIPVRSLVKIGPFDNSRNVVQGQNIVLACNITQGFPLPVLKWYKDEQELNISDPRVTIKTDNRGIEGSELIIMDANFEDRAEYTCNATNEISSANATILVRVKDKYAALWPFLGICAEVAVLCTIIFIYEKRRQKPDFDESETEHNTENKNVADQEGKSGEVRQRK